MITSCQAVFYRPKVSESARSECVFSRANQIKGSGRSEIPDKVPRSSWVLVLGYLLSGVLWSSWVGGSASPSVSQHFCLGKARVSDTEALEGYTVFVGAGFMKHSTFCDLNWEECCPTHLCWIFPSPLNSARRVHRAPAASASAGPILHVLGNWNKVGFCCQVAL